MSSEGSTESIKCSLTQTKQKQCSLANTELACRNAFITEHHDTRTTAHGLFTADGLTAEYRQAKSVKKISSLIHLNINTLVASFDRYAELKEADGKHRLCG